MKRRILSLLLTAAMLLGMLPGAAFATENTAADIVCLSYAHDGKYLALGEETYLAYAPVKLSDLAGIDLDSYGLSEYQYDADGDGSFEITVLHLVIYAHENLYGGDFMSDVTVSGGAGSIYFENGLFGYDSNMNYYVNGIYPQVDGWGTTADQIVLSDGDYVDFSHYTSWDYYSDPGAGFHYFMADERIIHAYTATVGEALTVTLGRAAKDINGSGETALNPETPADYCDADGDTLTYSISCEALRLNQTLEGSAYSEAIPAAGTYIFVLTANDGTDSTNHTVTVTVTAPPTVAGSRARIIRST